MRALFVPLVRCPDGHTLFGPVSGRPYFLCPGKHNRPRQRKERVQRHAGPVSGRPYCAAALGDRTRNKAKKTSRKESLFVVCFARTAPRPLPGTRSTEGYNASSRRQERQRGHPAGHPEHRGLQRIKPGRVCRRRLVARGVGKPGRLGWGTMPPPRSCAESAWRPPWPDRLPARRQ